jgi:tetratricopeptide (TPR) repeat protein
MRWAATLWRAVQSRIAGRLEEAEALNHEALDMATATGAPDAFRYFGGMLFWIRYDQGRMEELLDRFRRSAGRQGAPALTRALLCVALCELDRPDEARPVFDDLAAGDFAAVRYPWLGSLTTLALVCANLDDTERAAPLYERLTPYFSLLPTPGLAIVEPVVHYLGLLATTLNRYDEADAHFDEAARIEERMGAPCFLARTRLAWAKMLTRRAGPGDTDRARELTSAALGGAEEQGMSRVAEQARALLAG